jgi:hypothetical protein
MLKLALPSTKGTNLVFLIIFFIPCEEVPVKKMPYNKAISDVQEW